MYFLPGGIRRSFSYRHRILIVFPIPVQKNQAERIDVFAQGTRSHFAYTKKISIRLKRKNCATVTQGLNVRSFSLDGNSDADFKAQFSGRKQNP
jgi:hypothetical protein